MSMPTTSPVCLVREGHNARRLIPIAQPIAVLVRNLHRAGATPAMVEMAVAELEVELALLRDQEQSEFLVNPTVANKNPTVVAEQRKQSSTAKFKPDGEMRAWADPWELARKCDPMVVRRAIETFAGLSRKHRAVGLAIVASYNRKTGRCDPSAEKIAELAGCNRSTVFDALKALANTKLIVRHSYGGKHHSNAYVLGWDVAARQLDGGAQQSDFNRRQQSESDPNPEYIYNKLPTTGESVGRKRRRWETDRRQPSLLLPMAGGKSLPQPTFKPTPEAIRAKAAQRLRRDLAQRHGGRAIADDPDAWQAGIEAEMQVKGSGLAAHDAVLLGALERRRRTGSGPPG